MLAKLLGDALVKKKTVELDILSHILVPEMKILNEKQKTEVLKQYGIIENQLPRILSTDPVAVTLKANSGDIIQIKREDSTATYNSYRVVVNKS